MRQYKNFDTGEIWEEDEIRQIYESEVSLLEQFQSFDEYLEHLLDQGRARTGGIVEVEE